MEKSKIENKKVKNSSNSGITLIALVVTIIVLLILAAVSIQMLTGDNGIITNASKVSTSNAYYSAEEQVKLAYMAVKAEISAKTVKSGTYDPTGSDETTALATIVANDLGANQTGSKWAVDGSTAGTIKITYTDPKIDKGTAGTVDGVAVPKEEGKVQYKIILHKSQDATLYTDTAGMKSVSEIALEAASKTGDDKKAYYQSIYGSVVNYVPQTNVETSTDTANTSKPAQWKIFYIGPMGKTGNETESHIYLIADSYVKYDTLPKKIIDTTTTYAYLQSDSNNLYKTKFSSNGSDGIFPYYPYETTANIPKLRINSQYATEAEIKRLNYSYWIENHKTGANKINMRAVSSMLDTDLWKTYMDTSGKAQYAIGGPTVEMLFKSYNQTHGTNYGAEATSDNGYQITSDTTAETVSWANNIGSMLKTSSNESSSMPANIKTLYVSETGTTNANAYWLASPSANNANYVMGVSRDGNVADYGYDYSPFGFRPVVCLKSSVQLVEASQAKKDQGIDFELR